MSTSPSTSLIIVSIAVGIFPWALRSSPLSILLTLDCHLVVSPRWSTGVIMILFLVSWRNEFRRSALTHIAPRSIWLIFIKIVISFFSPMTLILRVESLSPLLNLIIVSNIWGLIVVSRRFTIVLVPCIVNLGLSFWIQLSLCLWLVL